MSDLPIVAWFKPAEGRRGAAVHVRKVDAPDWQASRDAAYVADGWQPLASLASAQQRIEELERALGERWIPVTERRPGPEVGIVLAAFEMDRPGDWRMKCASYEPECRDPEVRAQDGWRIFGGGWIPTHWRPLPAPPEAACAVATATRPSKGFLKGESPQATWPWDVASKSSEP